MVDWVCLCFTLSPRCRWKGEVDPRLRGNYSTSHPAAPGIELHTCFNWSVCCCSLRQYFQLYVIWRFFFPAHFFNIPILSLIRILLCTKMSNTYLVLRVLLSLFLVEKSSLYANCAYTLSVHTLNVALLLYWHGTMWPGWTNERGFAWST